MKNLKFALFTALLLGAVTYIFAVTAAACWEDFRVRIMWCVDNFPNDSVAEAGCINAATIALQDYLLHATYPDKNQIFLEKLVTVRTFRSTGKPVEESYTFNVETEGDYFINIANGVKTGDDKTQISSAVIKLDEVEIVHPDDFNQNVYFKAIPVHLSAGNHTLLVELRSKPKSFITIVICEKDMTGIVNP